MRLGIYLLNSPPNINEKVQVLGIRSGVRIGCIGVGVIAQAEACRNAVAAGAADQWLSNQPSDCSIALLDESSLCVQTLQARNDRNWTCVK